MNNTNTVPSNEAPESLPDYKVAADELAAFYDTLGISAEISGAHAAVDEGDTGFAKGWAHVAVTVTFTRPLVCDGPNRYKSASFSTPFKMGVGLADWGKALKSPSFSRHSSEYRDIELMAKSSSRLTVDSQRNICAKHLSFFAKRVSPAEVLANLCRDGLDASGQSFENWASEYGYDTDSRRAEMVYLECQRAGDNARKILSHSPGAMEKLAELFSRL